MVTTKKQTKVGDIEAGRLKELLYELGVRLVEKPKEIENRKYVYGLKGIEELFHVSHATAQKLKNGVLKDAVSQQGRILLVDVEKALRLFGNKNDKS
jgi:hypothetical protein